MFSVVAPYHQCRGLSHKCNGAHNDVNYEWALGTFLLGHQFLCHFVAHQGTSNPITITKAINFQSTS